MYIHLLHAIFMIKRATHIFRTTLLTLAVCLASTLVASSNALQEEIYNAVRTALLLNAEFAKRPKM